MSLYVEDYSERAIVVRGETKNYKKGLAQLGGKYNARLRDGAGWIFPKKRQKEVDSFIENATPEEEGDEEKSKKYKNSSSSSDITDRLDRIENLLNKLLSIVGEEGGGLEEGEVVAQMPRLLRRS